MYRETYYNSEKQPFQKAGPRPSGRCYKNKDARLPQVAALSGRELAAPLKMVISERGCRADPVAAFTGRRAPSANQAGSQQLGLGSSETGEVQKEAAAPGLPKAGERGRQVAAGATGRRSVDAEPQEPRPAPEGKVGVVTCNVPVVHLDSSNPTMLPRHQRRPGILRAASWEV